MLQTFYDRQISVVQLDIFTNQTNSNRRSTCFNSSDNFSPRREVKRRINSQYITNLRVKTFIVQNERQFVNVACICCIDDILLFHVALVRNLALQLVANWLITSAHDDVWLNTPRTKLGHAVLRWLGLLLTTWSNEGNQRDVHITDIVTTNFVTELTYCFQKRQDLNVSNGATDFGNHYIDILSCKALNSTADLVCDVRDNLNCAS